MKINEFFMVIPKDSFDITSAVNSMYDMGSWEEIKNKVSSKLFNVFVGMDMIGVWQGDGWGCIFEGADTLPYIPQAIDLFGTSKMKKAFLSVFELYQDIMTFCNGNVRLYDIMDFLTSTRSYNPDYTPDNEDLKKYTKGEHAKLSQRYHKRLNALEELPDNNAIWGNETPNNGYESILKYIRENYDV